MSETKTEPTIGRNGTDLWVHQNRGPYLEVSTGPENGIWIEIEDGGDRQSVNLTRDEARAVAAHIIELVERLKEAGPYPFCSHPERCNAAGRCTAEIVCND